MVVRFALLAFAAAAAFVPTLAGAVAPTRSIEGPNAGSSPKDEPLPHRKRARERVANVPALPPVKPADLVAPVPARPSGLFEALRASVPAAAPVAQAAPPPASPTNWFANLFDLPTARPSAPASSGSASRARIDTLIASLARLNGVPESLVHRIVIRESKYNPGAVGRGGAMGLMQIKAGTARGVGYQGTAAGLLDAETNLTYGIKYLAGAYRTAGGNHDRAVSHYARGYYYAAKRQGTLAALHRGRQEADASASAPTETPAASSLFSFASAGSGSANDRSAR